MIKDSKILVVDDKPEDLKTIAGCLAPLGASVFSASDGTEAIAKAKETNPDIILLDIKIPKINGYVVCRMLKDNPQTRTIPVIIVTAFDEKEARKKGFEMGADDFLVKPIDEDTLRIRVNSLIRLKKLNDQLESIEDVLLAIVTIIDGKDSYTKGHTERVTKYALHLAKEIGLSSEQLYILEKSTKLHDIGKIGVPETTLNKPGALTEEEFNQIKQHPVIGEQICTHLKLSPLALQIIRAHHERYDGKGYPDGLAGEKIPVEARIIAVVDCYDAMSTDRPYRAKLPKERIISIFKAGLGTQWDKKIAGTFITMLEENKFPSP